MSAPSQIIATGLHSWFFFRFFAGAFRATLAISSYTNGGLAATINNPGQPTDAFVQVTIYQVNGLFQQELYRYHERSET